MYLHTAVKVLLQIISQTPAIILQIFKVFFSAVIPEHARCKQQPFVYTMPPDDSFFFVHLIPFTLTELFRFGVSHDIIGEISHKISGRSGIFIQHFSLRAVHKYIVTSICYQNHALLYRKAKYTNQLSSIGI